MSYHERNGLNFECRGLGFMCNMLNLEQESMLAAAGGGKELCGNMCGAVDIVSVVEPGLPHSLKAALK